MLSQPKKNCEKKKPKNCTTCKVIAYSASVLDFNSVQALWILVWVAVHSALSAALMRQGSRPVVLPNTCRPLSFSRFQVSAVRRAKTMHPATSLCKSILSSQALSVAALYLCRRLSHRVHISNRLQPHRRSVSSTLRHPFSGSLENAADDSTIRIWLLNGLACLWNKPVRKFQFWNGSPWNMMFTIVRFM